MIFKHCNLSFKNVSRADPSMKSFKKSFLFVVTPFKKVQFAKKSFIPVLELLVRAKKTILLIVFNFCTTFRSPKSEGYFLGTSSTNFKKSIGFCLRVHDKLNSKIPIDSLKTKICH